MTDTIEYKITHPTNGREILGEDYGTIDSETNGFDSTSFTAHYENGEELTDTELDEVFDGKELRELILEG